MLVIISCIIFVFGSMLLGIPLVAAFLGGSLVPLSLFGSIPLNVIPAKLFSSINVYSFLAVPFFMICGGLMDKGGIAKRLVDFAKSLVGWLPGSLAVCTFVASAFFGAVSGSAVATIAAIGGIMLPLLLEDGYPKPFALATVTTAGFLGIIIPPSIPMVLYGMTCGVSIADLFSSGFVPGVLLTASMSAYAVLWGWKHPEVSRSKFSIRNVLVSLKGAIWALLMPIIILGGIYSGLLTPTESSAIAVVWALIAGIFIYREIKPKDLYQIFIDSAKGSAMVLFIIATSTAFAWLFAYSGISAQLVNLVVGMNLTPTLFCLVTAIILLIFGTFLEGTAICVLLVPVLWPIAQALGIHVIHFGMIVCVSNVVGTMTPPVAVNIFSAASVTKLKMGEISKGEIPFLIGYIAVFFAVVLFPQLSTFLL